ncbi:TnsA-like heteromeric transposase endonuclease subunit [Plantactinospora sp. B5E13]|uniref:TnsA-like heteromeric transposase endonuclease subunit n=1 Tax=Plantactinospora sp. B5E13 TaxID=3153758 RepID=UPI00325CD372
MSKSLVEARPGGEFEAVYVDADGVESRVGWDRLAGVGLEWGRPVRRFPSYRGQRHYPGLYWSATMRRHVGYESWVERDHLVALDFDRAVVGIASQPFWLLWRGEDRAERRHAPDFFARLADGGAVVVDSRPGTRVRDRDVAAFTVTGQACRLLGWDYVVWDVLDPLVAGNLRWLAGYQHPRCFDEQVAGRLREVFARPRALMEGAELVGDPIAVLPVLFHLIWRGELVVDLSLVLGDRTVVRSAAGDGRGLGLFFKLCVVSGR